jgi:hypothetical protein
MKIWLTSFMVFLIYFGFHTGIGLAPGGTLLMPYVVCFAGAIGILLINPGEVRANLVWIYMVLATVLFVMAFITSRADNDLQHHVLSSGIFLYSLLIAYATFTGLSVMGRRRTSTLFLGIALALIAGSFLEAHAGLKPLSDAARNTMNSWRPGQIYNNDLRDITLYGGVRPCFLASEPSILGISTGYALLFWFLSGERFTKWRMLGATLLAGVAFVIIRSPTILVCSFIGAMFFLTELGRTKSVPRSRLIAAGTLSLAAIFIAPIIVAANTSYGRTSASFYEREIGPPLVTAEVLRSQPLFGTGFGGTQGLVQYGQTVYSKAGGEVQAQLLQDSMGSESDAKRLLGSQFWEVWIDLGIVGGVLVLTILWSVLGQLSVPNRFLVFCTSALILTMLGGAVTPGGWIGLFSIAALYRMHHAGIVGQAAKLPV